MLVRSPTSRVINSFPTPTRRLESFYPFLLPSKGALLVSLCWVAWFVHRNIHIPGQLIAQGGAGGQKPNRGGNAPLLAGRAVRGLPVRGLHADGTDVDYRCAVGEKVYQSKRYRLWGGIKGDRQPLAHPLNQSGVLDFAVHISEMKLRVLIVGNSLGEQLHAGLEEAMCYPPNMTAFVTSSDRQFMSTLSTCNTTYASNPDGQWIKEPRIVSSQSGGLLAVVKDNTNMIDTKTKWNRNNTAISSLMSALGNQRSSKRISLSSIDENKLLDVLIYQFQSGHIDLHDFDEHYLEEAILAASDLFQATSVVLPTVAWMNNVDSAKVEIWREVNDRIRKFGQLYTPNENMTVESVQVLDIAALSREYIETNAKILDISPNETYSLRLENLWESLVAQICASLPFADDAKGCLPGMVSLDGMHICPETFHGRINAALVCLLDCKFNQQLRHHSLSACSDGCNSKYMNFNPIAFPLSVDLQEEIFLTTDMP
ncbi:hypothetical protein ACHAWF_006466 [Thalassiosira exigua]